VRPERTIAWCFGLSALASLGLVVLYLFGGQPQAEGVLLGLALGGLGVGLALWANALLHEGEVTEQREQLVSAPAERAAAERALDEPAVTRRRLLLRALGAATGALAGALAIPSLSLGPQPGSSLFRTRWRAGARVVDQDGRPLRPTDLPLESVRTVFPEGAVGSADSQTLLIRVDQALLRLPADRAAFAPQGCVAYSKICTHAGCPVGLYRAEAHELLCPCHQSTFDVLRGALPVFGPAARPLPQLRLELDDDGYLVAAGDYDEPVGPSFWNLSSGQA
jgi:ubiquinol-cytochrome c reductase iron-sulfur subunit